MIGIGKNKGRLALALVVALLIVPTAAWASGFQVYVSDAESEAKAGTGIALANNAGTLFMNPAGLSFLDNQVTVGATFLVPDSDFTPGATMRGAWLATYGQVLAEDYDQEDHTYFVPHNYLNWGLTDRLNLGVGMYSTYGLGVDWDDNFVGRYSTARANLKSIWLSAALSWKLNDDWALAFGLSIVKTEIKLTRNIPTFILVYATMAGSLLDPTPALGLNHEMYDGVSFLEADDLSFGFTLGLQGKLSEHTRLGLVYRSKVSNNGDGHIDFTFPGGITAVPPDPVGFIPLIAPGFVDSDAHVDNMDLPASAGIGIAWVYDRWNIEFDVTWTNWSDFDDVTITVDTPSLFAGEVLHTHWDSTLSFRLGGEYWVTENVALRLGVYTDESPIPDETLSPMLPGSDRWSLTAGLGIKHGHWDVDMFIQGLWLDDRNIETPNITQFDSISGLFPLMLDGEYTESTFMFGFSATYHF